MTAVLLLCCAGDRVRRRLHLWQSAAQQEEQEELEETVVPPKRQGALHLSSPRGEGKHALPFNLNSTYSHLNRPYTVRSEAISCIKITKSAEMHPVTSLYLIIHFCSPDSFSVCRRK